LKTQLDDITIRELLLNYLADEDLVCGSLNRQKRPISVCGPSHNTL